MEVFDHEQNQTTERRKSHDPVSAGQMPERAEHDHLDVRTGRTAAGYAHDQQAVQRAGVYLGLPAGPLGGSGPGHLERGRAADQGLGGFFR